MTPVFLRCEYLESPLGIDSTRPRLAWLFSEDSSSRRGQVQTAYQILVASSEKFLAEERGDLWESGKVLSDQSTQVEYAGAALTSLLLCHWKVRIWDREGHPSDWSTLAHWRMGLLKTEDWSAQWILGPFEDTPGACPWFRKTFVLEEMPETAIACISSIGYHELYLNGRKVGDQVLTPSVSDLRKRALYLTHDVTPYLKPGRNAVAIWLAPGWSMFRDDNPPLDFELERKPLCLARLDFGPARAPIVTDESWLCAPSNTSHLGRWQNSDFGGDRIDATIPSAGWNEADFDDGAWPKAVAVDGSRWELSSDLIEPNRLCEKIPATQMTKVGERKYRFIMARLFAGWVEVKVRGRRGTTVTIKVSSLADRELEYNQQNQYVIGATEEGIFRNRFSYHECGFVTVEGLEEEPTLSDVAGYRVTNDRKRTGAFDCSNPLLKQIYDITVHTYVNLCTGGMTVDCPHRERLGYGGDGHVSLEIALDTFASDLFLSKWAQDWCDSQSEDGRIPHTAPTLGGGGGPAWSGLIITLPWEVYRSYGDRRILEKTYPFAKKWLVYLARNVGHDDLLAPLPAGPWADMNGNEWLFLGDWVAPGRHEWSSTPEALLFNNCYYLYVLGLMTGMAKILGQADDENDFLSQAEKLKKAINDRFLNAATKAYLDTRQTHCVMPLLAGAVQEGSIEAVKQNLEDEILTSCKGHLNTGMHGTYFMTKYLVEQDRNDLIFTYASQTTYPGYGDLIVKGYETWPESWEEADSRLHGCLNGIGGWFQRGLAGIRSDSLAPGYKKIIIKPAVVGNLAWVNAHHDSPHGRIVCNWQRQGDAFTLEVHIPSNTSAIIHLPLANRDNVLESNRPLARAEDIEFLRTDKNALLVGVGSGKYLFTGRL